MLVKELYIDGPALTSSYDLENARPGLDPVWWLHGLAHVEVLENGKCFIYKYKQEAARIFGESGEPAGFFSSLAPIPCEGLSNRIHSTKKAKRRKKSKNRRVRKA